MASRSVPWWMKTIQKLKVFFSGHADAERGRYHVKFEDTFDAVALGDYGSDESAIPKSLCDKIVKHDPSVVVEEFQKPAKLRAAIKSTAENPIVFTASKLVRLSITFYPPESNLPIRVRGIKFLVVDQEMDDLLIGRPFLQAIGFDLDSYLRAVGDLVHDKHVDELNSVDLKASTAQYKGLQYGVAEDDPIELRETAGATIGVDSDKEIQNAFQKILGGAAKNGTSSSGVQRLSKMLNRHRHIFRIRLGSDPPAKVAPLVVTPTKNARPFRSPQRRYATAQKAFISSTVRKLESIGAIYKNPSSRWASPALAVLKLGSEKLRLSVDLRGPNAQTEPIQSAMPHLESTLQLVEGSTCFAKIDMAHAYWQLPLAKESQEMLSIQTPLGVYSSNRVLQGGTDAGNHFQVVTAEAFAERVRKLLQWIDDFVLYAKKESEVLENILEILKVCDGNNLKVHALKTMLFLRKATYCGRILSRNGIQFDPRHFDTLLSMKTPTYGHELQQLVCATNWMRISTPAYAQVIAPLHSLMEAAYKEAGSRTKKAVSKICIRDSWGSEHDDAFTRIQQQLAASTKLAHPKSDHTMYLFTDASDTHWAAILTQIPNSQKRKPVEEQEHEPLCFLSGAVTGASRNWSVPEKEGFAIVEDMCRLDYLITGGTVSIYTDHANLVYLFDPYGKNPGISRHTASKFMRWALKLSAFRYVIEHMPGEHNVWADILTRWAVEPRREVSPDGKVSLKTLMLAPISPGLDSRLDWPDLKVVRESQSSSKCQPGSRFKIKDRVRKDEREVIWIPEDDELLKLRVIIAAHTGIGGHRAWKTTLATIRGHLHWKDMNDDVQNFVRSCIHCLCTSSGETIPRPLGETMHGSKPNELIHFDYCYMAPGEDSLCYVMILKEDFSGYVWFIATDTTDAVTTADALMSWFAAFGFVQNWVSDQASHFKNELMKALRDASRGNHHFTPAYSPWSNGTVERVCRELIRYLRALISEFQFPLRCWPSVIPIVQSVLNNAPLARMGNRCALIVFTGMDQDSPLLSIKRKSEKHVRVSSISDVRAHQVMNPESLTKALEAMHRAVTASTSAARKRSIASHNGKTNVRPVNFTEGDFVLRGIYEREKGRKPSLRWKGPYRIVQCKSEFLFDIEDLITKRTMEVHGRRLKLFRNSDFQITEEFRNHLAYQENELIVVQEFQNIRRCNGIIELEVKWKGFDETENAWVTYESLREDVPVHLQEYLADVGKNGTPRQRQLLQSLL